MTDKLSIDYLRKSFKDGWWPYVLGSGPAMEATAWCAIASRKDPKLAKRSLEYLLSNQQSDGGWCNSPAGKTSDWSTGIALLATNVLHTELADNAADISNSVKEAVVKGTKFLAGYRADFITEAARVGMMLVEGPDFDYPRGWPWAPKTFNWIEPSSYAILAIKLGPLSSEKHYHKVLSEAHKYMFEKCCTDGGWNFGSPVTLGTTWPATPSPTALGLIALQDQTGTNIDRALQRLRTFPPESVESTISESLAIIARDLHKDDVSKLIVDLHSNYKRRENPGETLVGVAAGTIATNLAQQGNPFRIKTAS